MYLEYLFQENEFAIDSFPGEDMYHQTLDKAKELGHTVAQHAKDPNMPAAVGNAVHTAGTGLPGKLAFGGLAGYAAYKLAKAAKERISGR